MSFSPFLLQILYFKLKKNHDPSKKQANQKNKPLKKYQKTNKQKITTKKKKKKNTKQQHIYTNPECAKNGLISRNDLHSALPAPRSCSGQTLRSHR